jgi:hypothetical protein
MGETTSQGSGMRASGRGMITPWAASEIRAAIRFIRADLIGAVVVLAGVAVSLDSSTAVSWVPPATRGHTSDLTNRETASQPDLDGNSWRWDSPGLAWPFAEPAVDLVGHRPDLGCTLPLPRRGPERTSSASAKKRRGSGPLLLDREASRHEARRGDDPTCRRRCV